MARLAQIEKRLGPEKAQVAAKRSVEESMPAVTVDENEVPPPPRE
jgi:hypothetical protein